MLYSQFIAMQYFACNDVIYAIQRDEPLLALDDDDIW